MLLNKSQIILKIITCLENANVKLGLYDYFLLNYRNNTKSILTKISVS